MKAETKLILASGSPRRLEMLRQIGIEPHAIHPVEADEAPLEKETPRALASRLALEKARLAKEKIQGEESESAFILGADTVVSVGRRILPKAETIEQAVKCLELLSGRAHRVHTAIALLSPEGVESRKLAETRIKFKRLSEQEKNAYLDSGEWLGKAGGYAIQGIAGAFVIRMIGSYSNVVGLPLYETAILLGGAGYPVTQGWKRQALASKR